MSDDAPLAGVVCDDRPEVRRTVTAVLTRCGFVVVGEVETFPELCDVVQEAQPVVAVMSLPVAGMGSLAAVSALRAQAPACEVVVLSAFDQLQLAAFEAGAKALVPEDDPQTLKAVLTDIRAEVLAQAERRLPPAPRTQGVAPSTPATSSDVPLRCNGSVTTNPSSP